ncbi:MAG: deoxyhypusine synthase family protein [Candidatus Taylorbacteria bacterium]|nr:deoxyhypusine synthase family protein [Candidatus Taylorbacteria bacterium]
MEHRDPKHYHTGFDDRLVPLEPLDISKTSDFDEMLQAMSKTAFGGRKTGEAVETLVKMVTDPDTFVVMSSSGAMTPAKMGPLFCEMMERGFVHAVVSTGALMTHGFVESSGRTHFKYDPKMNDIELYKAGYDRIYDVLEPEKNLDEVEEIIYKVLGGLNPYITLSSRLVTKELGQWLNHNMGGRGILKSAYDYNVPVYIPAFTDSEMGLDVALYNMRRAAEGKNPFQYNDFIDLYHYMELINQQKKVGLFTIGGGVPLNWKRQVCPFRELIQSRMPEGKGPKHITGELKFSYSVRICPEPAEWGGLSGSEDNEAKSWGKLTADAQTCHVKVDATVVWPWILKATVQRLEKMGISKVTKNFDLKAQVKKAEELIIPYTKIC